MTNVLMILTGALVLIFITIISLKKPIVYMWLYLLTSTKFLGFADFSSIEIRGMFNVMLYMNIISIISIIITIARDKKYNFPLNLN